MIGRTGKKYEKETMWMSLGCVCESSRERVESEKRMVAWLSVGANEGTGQ